MSIQGEIRTLYSDREQTQAVFPRTKMSAVSDENGVGLNVRLKNAAPRNLLDNSDFRNPVNQRGQASYNSDGYCFDRWIIWHDNGGCSVTYDSDKKCIRIVTESSITLYQRLPKGVLDRNKKYTQAFGLTDGRTIIGTRIDYSPENYDSVEGIVINNGQAEIVWAALYEGEYTAETLPEYQPKGYAAELAECQRYYYYLSDFIAYGYGGSYGEFCYSLLLPTKMRIIPTATYGECTLRSGTTTVTLNRIDQQKTTRHVEFQFITLDAGLTGKNMMARLKNVCISADL